MTRQIKIEIECGDLTCASEPGKFCRWADRRSFGRKPICTLFPDPTETRAYTELVYVDGWLQRCPQCLATAKPLSLDPPAPYVEERDSELADTTLRMCSPSHVILEFKANGDVFYEGKFLDSDKQIIEGIRKWLTNPYFEATEELKNAAFELVKSCEEDVLKDVVFEEFKKVAKRHPDWDG